MEDDGQSDLAPLSPVRRILAEIFSELQEGWLTPDTTPDLLLKSMMMALIQVGISIILMLNLIYDQTEAFLVFLSLLPIMVLTKLIVRPVAMIIQFPREYFQWLRSFSSCSW